MLRKYNTMNEMVWMLVVDGVITWHEHEQDAVDSANWEIKQAKEGDYGVQVFVARSVWQNG